MSSVTRLHDSGAQGQAAALLALAKPTTAPLSAASVAATATELRLSRWTIGSDGAVTLASTVTKAHAATQLDAALIASPVVAGYRDAATGNLHVLSFNPGGSVNVGRGAIDDRRLAVVRQDFDNAWFVAFADTDGNLKVEFWQFTGTGDNPHPTFVSAALAGASSHIAGTFAAGRLLTAVRTGGNLKLITWGLDAQNQVQRLGDSGGQGGAVQDLAVSGFSSLDDIAGQLVVTAAKDAAGNLEIVSWRVNSDGSVTKLATHAGGAVGELAITPFQEVVFANRGMFVTAVTNGSGDLEVIGWRLQSDGSIQRLASATAGAGSQVAVIDTDSDMVATTCLTGSGIEKLITWRIA